MHPHDTPNGSTPALPGWSRTALALIAMASDEPVDLYLRVSGGKQEKEQTIATQRDIITSGIELCGGRVGEEFKDDPFTGTVADRPGLNKLRAAARLSHKANRRRYLLIYDTSRLARGEPWLRPMIEDELRRLGVQFAYVLNETDDSDEGMVMDGLRSLFDSWERKKIARRLKDGRERKIKRGAIWRGVRPFGWIYRTADELDDSTAGTGRHPKDGEAVQHPDEAPIVSEIMERVASGEMSSYRMAEELNRRGIRTTSGGEWHRVAVQRVITNPMHSGRVPEARYRTVEPRRRRKSMEERKTKHLRSSHKLLAPHEQVLLVRQPRPILSPELQDAAIAALARNASIRNPTRPTNRVFVLRGLLYCMAPRPDHPELPCDCRMQGDGRPNRRPAYRCRKLYLETAARPRKRCRLHIKAEYIESLVWYHLRDNIIERHQDLLAEVGLAQQTDAEVLARAEAEVAAAARALEAATSAVDGVVRLYRLNKITEEDYHRHYAEACREREDARIRVAEAARARADVEHCAQRWADYEDFFRDMKSGLDAAEAPGEEGARLRAAHIRRLVERVEIYPDGRKILIGRLPSLSGPLSERSQREQTH